VSAKNVYHDDVVAALQADGWTITDDPLTLSYGGRDLYVDLGAEKATIAAEKGSDRIAVEVQSFLNLSAVRDLEQAVGQFEIYRAILEKTEPNRRLYLAVPRRIHDGLMSEPLGQLIIARVQIHYLVFSEEEKKVLQWIN
jgi:hypothetical protein